MAGNYNAINPKQRTTANLGCTRKAGNCLHAGIIRTESVGNISRGRLS